MCSFENCSVYVRQLNCGVANVYMRSRLIRAYLSTFDVLVAAATLTFFVSNSFCSSHSTRFAQEWNKWLPFMCTGTPPAQRSNSNSSTYARAPISSTLTLAETTNEAKVFRSVRLANRMRSCRSNVTHKQMIETHSTVCCSHPFVDDDGEMAKDERNVYV